MYALREEGDLPDRQQRWYPDEFLSTPSARRATRCGVVRCQILQISIHALREEGDSYCECMALKHKLFLSTPSARRATGAGALLVAFANFYPRPP